MKRTVNRMIARLAMFLIAIVLGAIAVAQANRGVEARRNAGSSEPVAARTTVVPPIPIESKLRSIPETEQVAAGSKGYMNDVGPSANSAGFEEPFAPEPTAVQPVEFEDDPIESSSPVDDFASDPLPAQPPATMDEPQFDAPPATDFAQDDFSQDDFGPPQTYEPEPEFQPPASDTTYDADFGPPPASGFAADPAPMNMEPVAETPPPAQTHMIENSLPPVQSLAPQSPEPSMPQTQFVQQSQLPQNSLPPADYRTAAVDNSFAPQASYSPQSPAVSGGDVGSGKPGPSELEGPQTPTLTIQKKSPPEVQVGQAAKFHVTVRNTGNIAAHDIIIRDEVPHGARLINTNPPATRAADGALVWQMGTIRPGSEVTTMMEIMPMEEGDIGSVATVAFQTSASGRTVATRPVLTLEHSTERQVMLGDEVVFRIEMTNTGTGVANNVMLIENVPHGLQHYDGSELEYRIGNLKPGESRTLELALKTAEPGLVQNLLMAKADGNIVVEDHCELEIVAPQIRLELTGPRRRFLERQANYEIHVANPGTATAQNIELVAHLPRALKFVGTNNAGNYDSQRHQVVWNLAKLPAQEMGSVELRTLPKKMGQHSIQVEARASGGLADAVEHDVAVEGLVALLYTVTDVSDPIEVGGQTTYEIHVVNQGSKTASNLQVGALIPPGMEAINGEGPTRVQISGNRVVFEPLPRLNAQADTFYKIHVKGLQPGDKRIQVQLLSDDVSQPVTKEESTHVYADE